MCSYCKWNVGALIILKNKTSWGIHEDQSITEQNESSYSDILKKPPAPTHNYSHVGTQQQWKVSDLPTSSGLWKLDNLESAPFLKYPHHISCYWNMSSLKIFFVQPLPVRLDLWSSFSSSFWFMYHGESVDYLLHSSMSVSVLMWPEVKEGSQSLSSL